MKRTILVVILAVVVSMDIPLGDAAKILMNPFDQGYNSRLKNMERMASILMEAGHDISFLVHEKYDVTRIPPGIKIIQYPVIEMSPLFVLG